MTETVSIREVGLRDGLQMVSTQLPTKTKLDWCTAQAAAGFSEIEVTSFVPPAVMPQFADAADVLRGSLQIKGLLASVLVPNFKGALRAMDAGARKITYVLSASEAHNQANTRRSTDASIAMARTLFEERRARGLTDKLQLSCIIATSFGCSIQGAVEPARGCDIAAQLADFGADEISLADTVGHADPGSVTSLFRDAMPGCGQAAMAAHFHDTRGMGLANVVAATEAGVRRFDAALGGLGGCPFAPGATGNIATEDCVYMMERLGMKTGVDMPALLKLRQMLATWLPGEELHGKMLRAGHIGYGGC
jgi:hydroxymethylglutaryl-CoA lyase